MSTSKSDAPTQRTIAPVVRKVKLTEQPSDFAYWQTQPYDQIGYPPNRIDLITTLPGVEFEDCYETRVVIVIDQTPVDFIDLESLKRNKQASGRLQDLADLENLE